ncbi:bifunctional protein-serine/threonine kinase/phosphatase [Pseudoalteromonas sp. OOF1S-7]|uniref:bifunctional protein-serine/threonine kinase/phosphatase n=1 Tax=Pseudoalteromonas sp. OOF1S-7 TaxID=2917757 RepID=UPI001EF6863B|nr:bifunctional protein-serine/threonine kinase/phosphatase [Pseudoalteromonas sp. OOF1S-7]MCG7533458.1 bifunctional protein-serine/threonine kinase/phosphatase [Pseudoalteromonas sp. OOF1S-7]
MQNITVLVGVKTTAGIKDINEDAAGFLIPQDSYLNKVKGLAFCIADGVSSAEAGKEASDTAVKRFLSEYFKTPDTWSVSRCGEQVLSAINLRLYRKSHQFKQDNKGYLTTLSCLILKGVHGHLFHVGDSRVFRLRSDSFEQLTTDHVTHLGQGKSFLSRALGMDNNIHIDYSNFELKVGDCYLLTTDGVHDFIPTAALIRALSSSASASDIACSLCEQAQTNGSDDNISCVVFRVTALPHQDENEFNADLTRLPFPPPLEAGLKLDGYRVIEELFASPRSQLYLVEDEESGQRYAMKTPSVNFEDDAHYIDRFLKEKWIGSRIDSPHVVRIIQHNRPRTALYYLMEHLDGQSLDNWLAKNAPLKPKHAIAIVKAIAKGLQAFHDNDATHQDLKPGNIMIMKDGSVKLVDFGSVFVAGVAELYRPIEHIGALGTASYSDPNYLVGKNSAIQGDVYSLATICYELFTGQLPYGDKVEACTSMHDYDKLRYQSATKYNPVIPVWFDKALQKGVSFDLTTRYQTIDALLEDLTKPNPLFLKPEPEPKEASSLVFWKLVSGFWFITLMLMIYLFSQSKF